MQAHVLEVGAFDYAGAAATVGQAAMKGGQKGGVRGALESVAHAGTDMAAMAVGSAVGAALGTVVGPVGTILGGAVGGLIGKLGHWFVGWVGEKIDKAKAGKKVKPTGKNFVAHLKKVAPDVHAALKKHPAAVKLLKKDPFHLYEPATAAGLKAQFKTKLAAAKKVGRRRVSAHVTRGSPLSTVNPLSVALRATEAKTLDVLHPEARRVANALQQNPALRSLPATRLAERLLVGPHQARAGMRHVLRLAGVGGTVHGESLDRAMSRGGKPNAPVFSSNAFSWMGSHMKTLLQQGAVRLRRANAAGPDEGGSSGGGGSSDSYGTIYVVRSGDTLRVVAQRCSPSHDGELWPALLAYNPSLAASGVDSVHPDTALPAGRELLLPNAWNLPAAPTPKPTPAPAPSGGAPVPTGPGGPLPGRLYQVRQGDTGQTIAALYTGSVNRWVDLVKANPETADEKWGFKAYPGKVVKVPAGWPDYPLGTSGNGVPPAPGPLPTPAPLPGPPVPLPQPGGPEAPDLPPVPPPSSSTGGGDLLPLLGIVLSLL